MTKRDVRAQPGRGAAELNALLALGIVTVEVRDGEEFYTFTPDLLDPIAASVLLGDLTSDEPPQS